MSRQTTFFRLVVVVKEAMPWTGLKELRPENVLLDQTLTELFSNSIWRGKGSPQVNVAMMSNYGGKRIR